MEHLDQKDLAKRWLRSPRTLEQWRWQGRGPRYLKIGSRVIYPLTEVEAYEAASLHANTFGPLCSDAQTERRGETDDPKVVVTAFLDAAENIQDPLGGLAEKTAANPGHALCAGSPGAARGFEERRTARLRAVASELKKAGQKVQ